MDLHAIRSALADKCKDAGYQSYAFAPEGAVTVNKVGCVVVNAPTAIKYRETLGTALITFPLTVLATAADFARAQEQLDIAFSTGGDTSLYVALEGARSDAWSKCHVESLGEGLRTMDNGGATVMAMDMVVSIRARTPDPA